MGVWPFSVFVCLFVCLILSESQVQLPLLSLIESRRFVSVHGKCVWCRQPSSQQFRNFDYQPCKAAHHNAVNIAFLRSNYLENVHLGHRCSQGCQHPEIDSSAFWFPVAADAISTTKPPPPLFPPFFPPSLSVAISGQHGVSCIDYMNR